MTILITVEHKILQDGEIPMYSNDIDKPAHIMSDINKMTTNVPVCETADREEFIVPLYSGLSLLEVQSVMLRWALANHISTYTVVIVEKDGLFGAFLRRT